MNQLAPDSSASGCIKPVSQPRSSGHRNKFRKSSLKGRIPFLHSNQMNRFLVAAFANLLSGNAYTALSSSVPGIGQQGRKRCLHDFCDHGCFPSCFHLLLLAEY